MGSFYYTVIDSKAQLPALYIALFPEGTSATAGMYSSVLLLHRCCAVQWNVQISAAQEDAARCHAAGSGVGLHTGEELCGLTAVHAS